MKAIRIAFLVLLVLTLNVSADYTWCPPEEPNCDGEELVQDPGDSGTGSKCLKCVHGGDGKTYCRDPQLYKPAQGEILAGCEAYTYCTWAGEWYCESTCKGSPCHMA